MEFPEARIYEETLNCLLYENRNGPDQELMQATSTRYVKNFNEMNRFTVNLFFFLLRLHVTSYTSDDEDDRQKSSCTTTPPGGAEGGNGAVGGGNGARVSQSSSGIKTPLTT